MSVDYQGIETYVLDLMSENKDKEVELSHWAQLTNSFIYSLIVVPGNPPCYFLDQRCAIAGTCTIPKQIFLSDLDILNKQCVVYFKISVEPCMPEMLRCFRL